MINLSWFLLALVSIAWSWVPIDIKVTQDGFSLIAEEVELKHLLMKVADINQKNVWVSPDLDTAISVHIDHLTWDDWVDYLSKIPDLKIDRKGSVVYFYPSNDLINHIIPERKYYYQPKYISLTDLVDRARENGIVIEYSEDSKAVVCNDESQMQRLMQLDQATQLAIMHSFLIRMDEDKMVKTGLNLGDWSGQYLYAWPIKQWLNQIDSLGIGQLVSQSEIIIKSNEVSILESGEEIPYVAYHDRDKPSYQFKKATFKLSVHTRNVDDDSAELDIHLQQDKFKPSSETSDLGLYTQTIQTALNMPYHQNVLLASFSEQEQQDREACHPWLDGLPLVETFFCQSLKRSRHNRLWLIAYLSRF